MPVTLEKIPGQEERVILSMGPQHPSTHGVLRLVLELEGETVIRAKYDIGYLHTGFEKSFESKTYTQGITLTDRMDYLAPLSNNLAFCLAAEKLLDLEIPPKARWVRVLLTELTRLGSHLVWLGTHAIDIGAMSVFLYCFREREDILRIFEMVSGQRMMTSYFRIGGLALEPPLGWVDRGTKFIDKMPARIDEDEALLTRNPLWVRRTQGVGYMSARDARALGVSRPSLRGEGFHPPVGEVYQCVESPRGELGIYMVSDGSPKPFRCHVRAPSFANLQALPKMIEGRLIADVVASIGSIDVVLGEIDR